MSRCFKVNKNLSENSEKFWYLRKKGRTDFLIKFEYYLF